MTSLLLQHENLLEGLDHHRIDLGRHKRNGQRALKAVESISSTAQVLHDHALVEIEGGQMVRQLLLVLQLDLTILYEHARILTLLALLLVCLLFGSGSLLVFDLGLLERQLNLLRLSRAEALDINQIFAVNVR